MLSPQKTQLGEWLNELFRIEQDVRLELEAKLSEVQFNWRPAPGKWSVAECLDHLAITTGLMLSKAKPALQQAKAEGKTGDEPYRYGIIGGWFVRMMEKPGRLPMPGPKNFAPGSGLSKQVVLARFSAAMQEFRETMTGSYGLALDKIKAGSSAEGAERLKLNLAAWYAANLAHGRRHLAQAIRVTAAPGFPC